MYWAVLLVLYVSIAVAAGSPARSYSRPKRPNVIMFVIDDLGWTDVGYHNGSDMFTPTLDALATSGVQLDNYYVNPVCSPSRSAFMQGMYPFHTGMQHFSTIKPASKAHMPTDIPTLAEALNAVGYDSQMVGKWHLGYSKWDYTPTFRGFNSHTGFYQGMEDYYMKNFSVPSNYFPYPMNGYDWWRNQTIARKDNNTFNLDLFEEDLDRILHNHAIGPQDKPLFVYMSHQIVHIPIEKSDGIANCSHIEDPLRQTYCGLMAVLDQSLERMMTTLKDTGLWDDTLLVVTTDNGGVPDYGEFPNSAGCNYPYRAGKGTLFQGGVKAVGFLQGGDNVLPSAMRGTSSNAFMHAVDLFPTIMGLANDGTSALPVTDGHDMWDVIFNSAVNNRTNIPLNINYDIEIPNSGVQVGLLTDDGWKVTLEQVKGETLVYDGWYPIPPQPVIPAPSNPNGTFLFNINDDPYEQHNLYDSNPEKVAELMNLLQEYMPIYQKPQKNAFDFLGIPNLFDGVWYPFEEKMDISL